jgi:hypothetical protein
MEIINQSARIPSVSNSLNHGWEVMKKYFLILFLAVLVVFLVTGPAQTFRWNVNPMHHMDWGWHIHGFGLLALGMFALIFGLFALAYVILIVPVFTYGAKMMFVQAVRDIRPDFNMIVRGFRENYLGIVLASLLTFALVALGFIMLIIPGIIVACRLAFVGYLVMDKKLDPIMAVEESWKMTRGHGWMIFWLAIVSFFIIIAGLCVVIVGIFPASVWVGSAFATLYQDVLAERDIVKQAAQQV